MKKYDVFISYRRIGGAETAKHLRDVLADRGYRVFFDTDSLRSGDFDTQLFDVIRGCKDFIVILTPGALDRCESKNDWVRLELACALKEGKNVVPVLAPGFTFPEELPEDIKAVSKKQGVAATVEYFDAVVEKLCSLLRAKSIRTEFLKKGLPALLAAALIIALLIGLWPKVLRPVLNPQAKKDDTAVSLSAAYILDLSRRLNEAYGYFQTTVSDTVGFLEEKASAPATLAAMRDEISYYGNIIQNDVAPAIEDPDEALLNALTVSERIDTFELSSAPSLAKMLISDIASHLLSIDKMLTDQGMTVRDVAVNVETLQSLALEECTYWLICTNQLFCAVDEKTVYSLLLKDGLTGMTNLWHTNYDWSTDPVALKASEDNCNQKMEQYLKQLETYMDMTEDTASQSELFSDTWSTMLAYLRGGDTEKALACIPTLTSIAKGNDMYTVAAQGAETWIRQGADMADGGCLLILGYTGELPDYPLKKQDMVISFNGKPVEAGADIPAELAAETCVMRILRPDENGVLQETELSVHLEDQEHLYAITIYD